MISFSIKMFVDYNAPGIKYTKLRRRRKLFADKNNCYFHALNIPKMKFEILEFVEGAKLARGVAVIIDVFRAFSVACYAYDSGVKGIIATDSVKNALQLKAEYSNAILAGERDERKIEGFDFGNSPTEIIQADLRGKTFIHTTTAGTQGLINATEADIVVTGSFVNAGAVSEYIKMLNPRVVSLVAMGYRASEPAEEDHMCARYIIDLLSGTSSVTDEKISSLMNTSGERFFNPVNANFSPPSDFFLCTVRNRFNFVLRAGKRSDGNISLARINI
jgi:2-phosphosulfolactate phosphatase